MVGSEKIGTVIFGLELTTYNYNIIITNPSTLYYNVLILVHNSYFIGYCIIVN